MLKPLFTDDQWEKVLNVFKSFQEFEPVLIHHRLIDVEAVHAIPKEPEFQRIK